MEITLGVTKDQLKSFLISLNWLNKGEEIISLEKPGEGNMNMVLRVVTNQRQLIIKQSKKFVNKYPTIPAPIDRIVTENQFYDLSGEVSGLNEYLPKKLGFSSKNYIMLLQDLGYGSDFTYLYKKGNEIGQSELECVLDFLSKLHKKDFSEEFIRKYPNNMELRKLNHQHLFVFPFLTDNGFDLDSIQPGLQELSIKYKTDLNLKAILLKLGKIYLSQGRALLHGDFFPGSWLKVEKTFKVIDPEFSFFGLAEFDLGIMAAHMRMAHQPEWGLNRIYKYYQENAIDEKLAMQFEGVEILRRIIGLAQLPLDLTLEGRNDLLKHAYNLVVTNQRQQRQLVHGSLD
jgi:5-methylthioribose kinase